MHEGLSNIYNIKLIPLNDLKKHLLQNISHRYVLLYSNIKNALKV